MPSGDCALVFALALSGAAAVMSAPGRARDVSDGVRWFIHASAAPDVVAAAGAIGDARQVPENPRGLAD